MEYYGIIMNHICDSTMIAGAFAPRDGAVVMAGKYKVL